ncbi:hypothetical protein ScPMuIL_010716 [Solemya velum]
MPPCPHMPPDRVGGKNVSYEHLPFKEIGDLFSELEPGGRYEPRNCLQNEVIAIVIPHRKRKVHLHILIRNLHEFLIKQQRNYVVYVVNQANFTKFNRGMLLNIGYAEAIKRHNIQCFIFHDVDLIPIDDRIIYRCSDQPMHLSAAIDKFNYRLPYAQIFGGVEAISTKQFADANGFSNIYFGWGNEDNDMYLRMKASGYSITRYPMDIAKYIMLEHDRDEYNQKSKSKHYLRNTRTCYRSHGLNTLEYTLLDIKETKLFTWINTSINETAIMNVSLY